MSWKASGKAKSITHGTNGRQIGMADKLVIMVLSDYFDEEDQCAWPSQARLAKECLITDRGLRGVLERLERFGLIRIEHGGHKGNKYFLPFAEEVEERSSVLVRNMEGDYRNGGSGDEERAGSYKPSIAVKLEPAVEPPENSTPINAENQEQQPCRKCGVVGRHNCGGFKSKKAQERERRRQEKKAHGFQDELPPRFVERTPFVVKATVPEEEPGEFPDLRELLERDKAMGR